MFVSGLLSTVGDNITNQSIPAASVDRRSMDNAHEREPADRGRQLRHAVPHAAVMYVPRRGPPRKSSHPARRVSSPLPPVEEVQAPPTAAMPSSTE